MRYHIYASAILFLKKLYSDKFDTVTIEKYKCHVML